MTYWEEHYKNGGISGTVVDAAKGKWEILSPFFSMELNNNKDKIFDILDMGCGDGTFISAIPGFIKYYYIGVDISEEVVKLNKSMDMKYINYIDIDHMKYFYAMDISNHNIDLDNRFDVVLCQDVLFHIMGESDYIQILKNMMSYSKKYIFIYTWKRNPFDGMMNKLTVNLMWLRRGMISNVIQSTVFRKPIYTDDIYQKYRDFDKYIPIFEKNGFKYIGMVDYPLDSAGAMYIFANDFINIDIKEIQSFISQDKDIREMSPMDLR